MISSATSELSKESDVGNGAREAARRLERQQVRFARHYLFPVQCICSLLVIVSVSVLIANSTGLAFWLGCFVLAVTLATSSLRVWMFATKRYPTDCETN